MTHFGQWRMGRSNYPPSRLGASRDLPHSLSCLFSGFCGDPVGDAESLGEDRANTWKEVESLNDHMEQSLAYWPALNSDLNGT